MAKNLDQLPDRYVSPSHSHEGSLDGSGYRFGIVCARFNRLITASLLMGAVSGLTDHGVLASDVHTLWVPGAFEVPLAMTRSFDNYDAMIAIACVIQGDTPHFDYVCQGITQGIVSAINEHKKPGVFCVLTTKTVEQATDRARPHCSSNKGYEAALTAIEMVTLLAN